jgi:hypothetical protein
MAQDPGGAVTPDEIVRAELARADRLRRVRDSGVRLWRTAPWAAAACALVAGIGRIAGWPGLFSITLLALALGSLAAYGIHARRPRPISDAEAGDLDARASLRGELRSAFWFAQHDVRDPWIDFHLTHAANRLRAIDWSALYPAERASREKTATALLTVLVLLAALFVPGRSPLSALTYDGRAADVRLRAGAIAAGVLPPALLEQIERLLSAAEASGGKSLTASQVRDLLAKLDQLKAAKADAAQRGADGRTPDPTKADAKALAERAKRDSEMDSLDPEVRDALTDMAKKLSEDEQTQTASAKEAAEAAGAKDTQQGDAAQSSASGNKQDGSVQSVKDAAGGGGVGIVMMSDQDGAKSKEAGLGLGGGSGDNKANGSMPDLAAALRRETVEAKNDNQGENIFTGVKRRTEQGDASVAYTHVQPGAAERGRSTAPPAVPDNRKASVRSYFTRKQ